MIISVIKEMRIAVMNIDEERQVKAILDNLGKKFIVEPRDEDGVKIIRVNLEIR